MPTKLTLTLTTALLLGSASAALAMEVPENKIDHKYPWLEQTVRAERPSNAYASARRAVRPFTQEEKRSFERTNRPGY